MGPSRYLLRRSGSSSVLFVMFGRLMKRSSDVLRLSESLNKGQNGGKALRISHLNSEVLRDTRASFVVLLIEAADFFVKNPAESTTLHASDFWRSGLQLQPKLYMLHAGCNEF